MGRVLAVAKLSNKRINASHSAVTARAYCGTRRARPPRALRWALAGPVVSIPFPDRSNQMTVPIESALVVLVPEAEALVASFRQSFDPSAALGVPAHVTVLYPFKPPHEMTPQDLQTLADLFTHCPAFAMAFTEPRRLPDVLYLAPTPAEPFRRLTEAVASAFRETAPYGGQFADVIPHLTVAQIRDAQRLEEIAADCQQIAKDGLPIKAQVSAVTLMDNRDGPWQVRHSFKLGGVSGAS